jgi:hypothetical protein
MGAFDLTAGFAAALTGAERCCAGLDRLSGEGVGGPRGGVVSAGERGVRSRFRGGGKAGAAVGGLGFCARGEVCDESGGI